MHFVSVRHLVWPCEGGGGAWYNIWTHGSGVLHMCMYNEGFHDSSH
jgi:hypothetical protein